MDAATTATRDGWQDHYQRATDLMADAADQFARAARHLEPLHKDRVIRVGKKLETAIGRAIRVQGDVTKARAAAAAVPVE